MHIVSKPPSDRDPRRMQALSVLPVFFSLEGKEALVCGGTDAAAWKAELLEAAGAIVHIAARAEALGDTMRKLIARGGGYVLLDADWRDGDFEGVAMAVADAETEVEAARFHAAAKRAGVPANVIDKPDFSDFQFGSIVNRSPIVVSISSDGAAPISLRRSAARSRRFCRRPSPHGRSWPSERGRSSIGGSRQGRAASLLGKIRRPRLRPGARSDDEAGVQRDIEALVAAPTKAQGSVTLVGAGPGDAELLTLKAMRRCRPPTSSCSTTWFPTRCWTSRDARRSEFSSESALDDRAASSMKSTT